MRPFTALEERNMEFLVNKNVKFTQLQITGTGNTKKCPDATLPMRMFFNEQGIYDYEIYTKENWGDASKEFRTTHILTATEDFQTTTSFYRANTRGDRRYNISGLTKYTGNDDIHVIFNIEREIFVIDITRIDIESVYNAGSNPIREYIDSINNASDEIPMELLGKLRRLSGQWHPTVCSGDTAVGRTVEFLLGLGYNPRAVPDYRGIELKSERARSRNGKNTMFGCFPDWDISRMTRDDLIRDYGHEYHDGIRRVFSTVATCHPNSDLFFLNINERTQRLEMLRNEEPVRDIVMWRMQKIHDALLNKHKQTFWIDVDSRMSDGQEYMMLKQVEYTRSPNVGQFDTLLAQNIINIDISVGRAKLNPNTGRMSGADNWNFRIGRRHRNLLFPQAAMYNLE